MAGLGLIGIAAGAITIWAGATGRSVFEVMKNLIGGKPITDAKPCVGAFGPFCTDAGGGGSPGGGLFPAPGGGAIPASSTAPGGTTFV